MRIGHGYDVHRLVSGRPCIIGGVNIPFELGLDGHSDADVLTHAVMDSLLGALHVIVRRRKQFGDNAFDIVSYVSSLSQRGCVGDRKRHIQKLRQCFDQIRLSASCRSDHQHIGFLDFNMICVIGQYPFIMVIYRN